MIILNILLLVIVIVLNVSLRKYKLEQKKIKLFESFSIIAFIFFVLFTSENISVLTILGTSLVSLAWVFKEFFANAGCTIIMNLLPQFEKNDLIQLEGMEPMLFEHVSFLRTKLKKSDGTVVYVPNRTLLNELVTVS